MEEHQSTATGEGRKSNSKADRSDENQDKQNDQRSSGRNRSRRGNAGDGNQADRPKIGDRRPAPQASGNADGGNSSAADSSNKNSSDDNEGGARSRRRGSRGGRRRRSGAKNDNSQNNDGRNDNGNDRANASDDGNTKSGSRRRRRGGRGRGKSKDQAPVQGSDGFTPIELDEETLAKRRGKERDGKPIGRYLMCVHVQEHARQIAILEGRNLIEYYVSRPTDAIAPIPGNIYIGRVQNVLPGMEAAFIDIGTPKNAVLYRGDVNFDPNDFEGKAPPRIEQVLRPRDMILCQVTKNPIAHKGARLTQEISLPGRYVVLMPNNSTYGISKRLPDKERKRLRKVLDEVKPAEHGVIVRTAAETVTAEELQRDVQRLLNQWERIQELA